MAKIAKTADRKKVMDTSKSTDCQCGKAHAHREGVKTANATSGGIFHLLLGLRIPYEKL